MQITGRGLVNMLVNHRETIFGPVVDSLGGRVLRIAHTVSFSFDMSWEELLWLVDGHEVHLLDEELRRDSDRLVDYCRRHSIDVINVTPSYCGQLIEDGLLDPDQYRPSLVLLGGEAVSDTVWQALRGAEGVLGYNLYGPTEYTINTLGGGTADSATPRLADRSLRQVYVWILRCARSPGTPASCTCPASDWPAAIGRADLTAGSSSPTRSGRRGPACTAPGTWCGGGRRPPRLPGPGRRPGEIRRVRVEPARSPPCWRSTGGGAGRGGCPEDALDGRNWSAVVPAAGAHRPGSAAPHLADLVPAAVPAHLVGSTGCR